MAPLFITLGELFWIGADYYISHIIYLFGTSFVMYFRIYNLASSISVSHQYMEGACVVFGVR
jgi:hypothetical protein